jgi:hypothetical protein
MLKGIEKVNRMKSWLTLRVGRCVKACVAFSKSIKGYFRVSEGTFPKKNDSGDKDGKYIGVFLFLGLGEGISLIDIFLYKQK